MGLLDEEARPCRGGPVPLYPHSSASRNDQPRQRTILLVEDEPFVREATCGILCNARFEVLLAKDAQHAIAVYEESERRTKADVDLLMTDMVLPGATTGRELGQALQRRSPGLVILVTSGYTNLEYEMETPASRTYFLAKPYSMRTLISKIETILGADLRGHAAAQAG
jgi:DNA-binding NtrC family response regulator